MKRFILKENQSLQRIYPSYSAKKIVFGFYMSVVQIVKNFLESQTVN